MQSRTNHVTSEQRLRNHLKWFLFLRVAIVSCFLGTVAFIQLVASHDYGTSTNWLLGIIAASYGVTIASALLLGRTQQTFAFAYTQLAVDIVLTSAAVFFTGDANSPFAFLYYLAIFSGAVLLYTRGAAFASLASVGAYTLVVVGLVRGAGLQVDSLPPATPLDADLIARLLLNNASFFIIAYLAGVLTQRLHDTERLLEVERDQHGCLARLQHTLARQIECGLLTTDADGRITSVNALVAELTGPEPILGQEIGTVFPPLHLTREARNAFFQSVSAAAPIEFSHTLPDQEPRILRCSAAPLHDTYQHPIGALYTLQDVTALRRLEQRYEQEGAGALDKAAEAVSVDTADEAPPIEGLVGRSEPMRCVAALITKVAATDATVLVCGESGTGKEVVARAIHAKSTRSDKPFVAINCGAIPENLIESELFGHVRGAFTGAVSNRAGFFRAADGGSVFLDEVGELPLAMQVKLLRVLQERVFKPVGSETHIAVNVRILAATNKDLPREVRSGRFREDLFYRLNVICIELPPLRDRLTDIPPLIRHYLRTFSELHRKRVTRLSVAAARRLLRYPYPGNVRELANIIEHAVTMCEAETVHESHLSPHVFQPPRQPSSMRAAQEEPREAEAPESASGNGNGTHFDNLDQYLADHEKAIILRALEQSGGVKKRAADLLGINYRSFRHRLSKYGLHNGESHAGMQ